MLGGTFFQINYNKFIVTKNVIGRSILIISIGIMIEGLGIRLNDINNSKALDISLTIGRTVFDYLSFFSDIIITLIYHAELTSIFKYLRVHDNSMKYHQKHQRLTGYFCRFIITVGLTFWILTGYLAYHVDVNYPLIDAIAYFFVYAAVSMQIIQFCGINLLIYCRFEHLQQIITSNGENKIYFLMILWLISINQVLC